VYKIVILAAAIRIGYEDHMPGQVGFEE